MDRFSIYIRQTFGVVLYPARMLFHFLIFVFALSNIVIRTESYLRWSYLLVILSQFGYIAYLFMTMRNEKDRNLKGWSYSLIGGFLAIEIVYLLQWTNLDQMAYIIATFHPASCWWQSTALA